MKTQETLTITNDGPRILTTNYWDTEHARGGKYYCSVNAGAIRILVPPQRAADIEEWNACRYVIVSRGPWPEMATPGCGGAALRRLRRLPILPAS